MILTLPIVYVASSGPVLRLILKEQVPYETAENFYHPLLALWPGPWEGRLVHAYLNLWGVGVMYSTFGSHIWLVLRPEKP